MSTRRTLAVGLIGYKFMGKAHSNAWRQAPRFFDLPADIQLKIICGRDAAATRKASQRFGWEKAETDWRRIIDDPGIHIVDICTPNDSHCEIAVAAAYAGKAILCEKPLARTLVEARRMLGAVKKARVANMICHNYRRIPAISLAKQMIAQGELGKLFHFRARYAQDWIVDPKFPLDWRLRSDVAGSGALGDIFSHVVGVPRFLVDELREVCGMMKPFVKERPISGRGRGRRGRVTVDDAVTMIGRFTNGALASIEATRFAPGRKNSITLEINGGEGSLLFDLEEMNRLKFFSRRDSKNLQGFRDIIVTEPSHPYIDKWWPPGHIIGYEHSFIHTIADFVRAVITGKNAPPTFADGVRNQCVLDAVSRSAHNKRWIQVSA